MISEEKKSTELNDSELDNVAGGKSADEQYLERGELQEEEDRRQEEGDVQEKPSDDSGDW